MTDFKNQILAVPEAAQTRTDWLPYPGSLTRGLLRLPMWGYRLGMARLMNHLQLMVLTTWGRKSGLPRHTVIEYRAHGTKIYLISAWGHRPNWYQNLMEHPVARVRCGQEVLNVRATVVTDSSEALRALYLFRKRAPSVYDTVVARLSNRKTANPRMLADISDQFTIVKLEPASDIVGPPAIEADLKWIWFAIGACLTALAAAVRVKQERNL